MVNKLEHNPALVKQWCEYLRTDDFEENSIMQNFVRKVGDKFCYCALGHAYRLGGAEVWFSKNTHQHYLDTSIFDVEDEVWDKVTSMNDNEYSGSEIADWLEKWYGV